jgi:hypothetical protein
MNGILMTEGIDAVSIPAVRAAEFNSRMVDFYVSRNATEMMAFLLDCHPEVAQIRHLNPGLSVVNDAPGIEYFRLDDSMTDSSLADDRTDKGKKRETDASPDLDPEG